MTPFQASIAACSKSLGSRSSPAPSTTMGSHSRSSPPSASMPSGWRPRPRATRSTKPGARACGSSVRPPTCPMSTSAAPRACRCSRPIGIGFSCGTWGAGCRRPMSRPSPSMPDGCGPAISTPGGRWSPRPIPGCGASPVMSTCSSPAAPCWGRPWSWGTTSRGSASAPGWPAPARHSSPPSPPSSTRAPHARPPTWPGSAAAGWRSIRRASRSRVWPRWRPVLAAFFSPHRGASMATTTSRGSARRPFAR